jgi:hypothetical protein
VVWSRLRAGYEIVSAPLQRAHGGVAFGADGTFALAVEARRARAAGLLPAAFAAPFASLATRAQTAPLYRETRLRAGERGTPLQPVAVSDLELWGEPTGAALAPDGQSAFVGQRRADGAERLVRLHLGCR